MNSLIHARGRIGSLGWAAGSAVLLGTLAGLAGCGDSDADRAAVEHAAVVLNGLGVSGGTPLLNADDRRTKYQSVITSLKDAAASETPARAAAAQMLVARGHAGLGELASEEAARAEADWLAKASAVRSAFDRGLSQQVVADALASYDPSKEQAELDTKIREREEDAARAVQAKQKQIEKVDAIKARAEQARVKARAEREREAELRASAQGASQTVKAGIIEEANRIKRQGDEFERTAATFDAEAAKEAPEVASIQSNVDKFNRQVELMRDAKESLTQRASASREQATHASREARETFQQVETLLGELTAARQETNAATEKAVSAYKAAASAAAKAAGAGKEMRTSSSIARGNYQQAMGDILASHSRGQRAFAVLLGAMQRAGKGGVTAAQVSEADQAYVQTREEAKAAYEEAQKLFAGAGATGSLSNRLADLSEKLNKLAEDTGATPTKPAADPNDDAPAGEDAPVEHPGGSGAMAPADGAGFDAAAVESEARPAFAQFAGAFKARNFDAMSEQCVFKSDKQKDAFLTLMSLFASGERFEKACNEKFGKGFEALVKESQQASVKGNPMLAQFSAMMKGMEEVRRLDDVDPATVPLTARSATEVEVADDDSGELTKFRKIDGVWKADADAMSKGAAAQMGPMLSMLKALAGVFGTVADDIGGGKYADGDAMLLDFNTKLMGAMMRAGPGGVPGGGG